MTFSNVAWQRIAPIYAKILQQPFNRELAAGTLSRERFVFYMIQDAQYLGGFGRALAAAAARAPDNDAMVQLAGSARTAVLVERALHEDYFRQFDVSAEKASIDPSPTCLAYTSYLVATCERDPYEVAIGALLPCFWIYWKVGEHIRERAAANNPYQAWIDTYAGEAFTEGTRRMIDLADRIAEPASAQQREAMQVAFVRASQYEWMFWDSAYRLERWPV